MQTFLLFFEMMPAWQKLAWLVGCLSFCWAMESVFPLVAHNYKKWKHAKINLSFLILSLLINFGFGMVALGIFEWIKVNEFGLLNLVNWPVWLELLGALLFFDLIAQYVVHYLLHKVSWMWRFHMIHHSDTKVDATSGTRHHPGDYIFRELFALLAAVIIGAPIAFYLFYRIITILFTYATHANITTPLWIDRSLGFIFITPNMHKFHHHHELPWTDTNFGNIFSIWDRLFGTLVIDNPRKVKYGLDVLDDHTDSDFGYQLKLPFRKKSKDIY